MSDISQNLPTNRLIRYNTDPDFIRRHMLWTGLGFDSQRIRQNTLRNAYFKLLANRESGNDYTKLRVYKKTKQPFSAGSFGIDRIGLAQMQQSGWLPKNWTLKDLTLRQNQQKVRQAV